MLPTGTAILAEDASHLIAGNLTIKDYQVGVAIDQSNNVRIVNNLFELSPATDIATKQGIVIINGNRPLIVSNTMLLTMNSA